MIDPSRRERAQSFVNPCLLIDNEAYTHICVANSAPRTNRQSEAGHQVATMVGWDVAHRAAKSPPSIAAATPRSAPVRWELASPDQSREPVERDDNDKNVEYGLLSGVGSAIRFSHLLRSLEARSRRATQSSSTGSRTARTVLCLLRSESRTPAASNRSMGNTDRSR